MKTDTQPELHLHIERIQEVSSKHESIYRSEDGMNPTTWNENSFTLLDTNPVNNLLIKQFIFHMTPYKLTIVKISKSNKMNCIIFWLKLDKIYQFKSLG